MGRKDFGHKETKKPKKDSKKILTTNIEPLPQVEVIKRVRKDRGEEEEE